jgi:tetratricopeptide (TPR) repeat protein
LRAYWSAIAYAPDFVDAYTNLAVHYMLVQGTLDREWPRRAEEALLSAHALDPDSLLVHYQLGKLYMLPAVGRYDEAKKELEAARPYVYSYARLGKLYLMVDGDYASALENLVRSLDLSWSPNTRLKLLVECVRRLQNATDPLPCAEHVEQAMQILHDMTDENRVPSDRLKKLGITKGQILVLLDFLKTAKVKTTVAPPEFQTEEEAPGIARPVIAPEATPAKGQAGQELQALMKAKAAGMT